MKLIRRFKPKGGGTADGESAGLLPWYLNHTLSADEAGAVEAWLRQDQAAAVELAVWQQAQEAVTDQLAEAPPPVVYQRVRAQVRPGPAPKPAPWLLRLAWGAAVGLAVLVLLWFVLQPGIVLDWSVQGDRVEAFRIYRAPLGTADFGLIGEVPVEPDVGRYRYVDARPWLAWAYVYRVEARGAGGHPLLSQAVSATAMEALPGQIAVLFLSLLAGIGAASLAGQRHFRAFGLAV